MKRFNTINGEELLNKELMEIPFVVKDLIPAGLTILAGAAKVGKSWFALWLAVQVAKGESIWGYETVKSTTLYLAYEDNEIRLQNRLLEISEDAPSNVHFCTEVSKLGGELEAKIDSFITEHKDTKLIIIDTLQTVRNNTESNYASDYSDLTTLKGIADKYQIAIVLIHHFRKSKDGDVFNQITGSTGLQGAVDNMFTLTSTRGDNKAILNCVGRDIEPREIELLRNDDNIWIKISDTYFESTILEDNFIKAVTKFMSDKDLYVGTPTELSQQLNEQGEDIFSNKIVSKFLKRLHQRLEKRCILSSLKRTNAKRIIELIKVSEDSENIIFGAKAS